MKKKILTVIMVLAISLGSLSAFTIVDNNVYTPEESCTYHEIVAARGPGSPGRYPPPDEYPD